MEPNLGEWGSETYLSLSFLSDLNRRNTHASCGGVNQDGLARLNPSSVVQSVYGSRIYYW